MSAKLPPAVPPLPRNGTLESGESGRTLPDGSRYVFRPDPGYPGIVQLILRSPDGVEGAGRLGRDQLRNLISDAVTAGGLQQTSPVIERSAMAGVLAGAMRRNLELIRDLAAKDPVAAEVLVKAILDDIKSWQPSMASGALGS